MRVRVVKPFRHFLRVYDVGEVGEVVTVEHPLTCRGKPVYDCYVKFPNTRPVGVHTSEVEEVE